MPPILCISNMPWDTIAPTNRQQLMRRLGQRTPVAVVEAPLPVAGSLVGRSKGRRRHPGWRQVDGVDVLQAWDWVPYPLAYRSKTLSHLADATFRTYIRAKWRRLGRGAPLLWLYAPDSADLLGLFGEQLSLYHCVDNYAAIERCGGYPRVAAYSPAKREETLVRAVDLLVTTSAPLFDRWSALNPHTHLWPNVADTALFGEALLPGAEHPALAQIGRPRVAYIGALDAYKVDFALLEGLAALCPEVQIVCVGPVGIGDGTPARALPRRGNLHYLGALPQVELPAILRGCVASLIPYHLNAYTIAVSPLKLYEYLAAGLPVVSTRLPALEPVPAPGILLADPTPASFAAQMRVGMALETDARRELARNARAHSWERRVDEFEALIHERLTSKLSGMAS